MVLQAQFFQLNRALARVDAAVGEDARAHHVRREAAGVRLSPVAGGPVDDAHGGLAGEVQRSAKVFFLGCVSRLWAREGVTQPVTFVKVE